MVTFVVIFSAIGVLLLFLVKAATPNASLEAENAALSGPAVSIDDSGASGGKAIKLGPPASVGTPTFKLLTPGWRGLGALSGTRTVNSVTSKFTEAFGQDDDFDPSQVNGAAKTYKYTLGLYVLSERVPCSIFPAGHEDASKCAANSSDPDWLDPSAFAKDAGGKAVYPVAFRNNFLIIPDSSAWLSQLSALSDNMLKYKNTSTQWGGLFSDSMGSPLGDLNNNPTTPAWDDARWLQASKTALQTQKSYLNGKGKPLMLNGLATGDRYFAASAPTSVFADSSTINGAMSERIFREPNSSATTYKSTGSWLKDIAMIEDIQSKGLKGYWWSKCWSNEKTVRACRDDADQNAVKKARRYSIGSYLLAAGSQSYFNWDEDYNYLDTSAGTANEGAAEYYGEYDRAIALGAATSGRTAVAGLSNIWKRDFGGGVVFVNPTGSNVTISLPAGNYMKLDCGSACASGNVSLPANSAEIFIRQ